MIAAEAALLLGFGQPARRALLSATLANALSVTAGFLVTSQLP